MTPDNSPDRPGPWPDVLAAYADGELDPAASAAVERWLAAHPRAAAELCAQRKFSPNNWCLWQQVEPTLPTNEAWAAAAKAVAAGVAASPVEPRRTRTAWVWGAGVVGGVAAAAVAAVLVFPSRPAAVPVLVPELARHQPDDPLADYDVLPVVAVADVDVQRVAGHGGWLPVGDPPLPGSLVLADADDVELHHAQPHSAWPAGGPSITTAPGDAPMIFAAKP